MYWFINLFGTDFKENQKKYIIYVFIKIKKVEFECSFQYIQELIYFFTNIVSPVRKRGV